VTPVARGVRIAARGVRIEARAKLNLGLAIGPRRSDGFHDLATIFQSVSLADTLIVTRRPRGFTLAVRHEDVSCPRPGGRARRRTAAIARVPTGAANLVLRAARRVADRFRLDAGARFSLVKRIPAGAGMGGGSADAAAAIAGLIRLFGLKTTRTERLALAAEIGSDVPFALLGGTALGCGRGERLQRRRLARPFRALLAVPPWRVETAQAFRSLDRSKYGLTGRNRILRFVEAVGREAVSAHRAMRLGNTFEQVLGERRSGFLSLCARLRRAGAQEPHLTGSGSAVFGIIPTGLPVKRIVDRFVGDEAVYLIRSRGTGLTHTTLR